MIIDLTLSILFQKMLIYFYLFNLFSFVLSTDDLGMSSTQQHNIGILVHVLYSNPKVLYAPANTSADLVIRQVRYF